MRSVYSAVLEIANRRFAARSTLWSSRRTIDPMTESRVQLQLVTVPTDPTYPWGPQFGIPEDVRSP